MYKIHHNGKKNMSQLTLFKEILLKNDNKTISINQAYKF